MECKAPSPILAADTGPTTTHIQTGPTNGTFSPFAEAQCIPSAQLFDVGYILPISNQQIHHSTQTPRGVVKMNGISKFRVNIVVCNSIPSAVVNLLRRNRHFVSDIKKRSTGDALGLCKGAESTIFWSCFNLRGCRAGVFRWSHGLSPSDDFSCSLIYTLCFSGH